RRLRFQPARDPRRQRLRRLAGGHGDAPPAGAVRVPRQLGGRHRAPPLMPSGPDRGTFRGPFADGPPPGELIVDPPPLRAFGPAELRRMAVIGWTVTVCLIAAMARWVTRPRRQSWQAAAANGVVDALCRLGPMFIKLGQLMGSSPSICPAPLSDAARRCIREVGPLDVATVRTVIERDLG